MSGEYSPEYSDLSPAIPSPAEAKELVLHESRRAYRDMGRQALTFDGFTVLDQPETGFPHLERRLRASIIGQDQAIEAIITAMDRSKVRLPDDPRPLATLAFLGPTGVGKSETAKVLASRFTEIDPRLVKIDCSNFSHGHEVAALIGSPPGYVGHEQEALLNRKRVEKPGTVILFDEVEKGSSPLFNLMLQILGDGKLQLNDGTTTSFRDTTIILTSNLGAKEMNEHLSKTPVGFGIEKEDPSKEVLEKSARKAFQEFFTPEFVNRLDGIITFNPLNKEGLGRILDNKLSQANEEYADSYGMAISLTEGAHNHLVNQALEERGMGARPLVRAFEKDVQSVFGRYLSGNQLLQGYEVYVHHKAECPEEVQRLFPSEELIFTHRFDQDLWERRNKVVEEIKEAKRRRDEEQRKKEEDEKSAKVVFDDGGSNPEPTPPEDAPNE